MTATRPQRRKKKTDRHIKLASALRMNTCPELKHQLVQQVEMPDPAPIELDASAVDSVDAAGLQLLVVFARECARRDIAWSWIHTSDALRQGSAMLGLDSSLAMPAAPANPQV